MPRLDPSPSPTVRIAVVHEDNIVAGVETLMAVLRGAPFRADHEPSDQTDENENESE